ncbi:Fic family protein [Texcoconibacillus texcoconensis]|uniref:Fic family protein n=1 Tax=Texcoconibacillus texcoconensis TaxID=1095777 RepID=A0A840QMA8_9BACI|nr:Fic family protein [Texcoconibacillus texcoconensis]MBB5172471.1 Fic family protein [Texcoconibacillus texcoconensis]
MKNPYHLPMLPVTFDTETELEFYKEVVDATAKLEKLKQKIRYSPVNESFLQLLTLHESVQSTRIEGTQVTFSEMLEDSIDERDDWERIEVRNYQKALRVGVESIQHGYPLTQRLIRDMHRSLMEDARGSAGGSGEYRKIQNFIGPTKDMKDASYIPPEPHRMDDYMSNLEHYINGHPYKKESDEKKLHPLIKTAVIHAQFESIHPFLDGNGRLGRILIVLYLLQTDIINSPFFFLSEELERERFKYYALLNGVRSIGKKEPDWRSWILFFLEATNRMAEKQFKKLDAAEELFEKGNRKLEQPSTQKVWEALFRQPIANVHQIQEITKMAPTTIRKSLRDLEQLNMIFGDDRKRNRRFYQYDLIRIMSD